MSAGAGVVLARSGAVLPLPACPPTSCSCPAPVSSRRPPRSWPRAVRSSRSSLRCRGTDGTDSEETHARITVPGAPPDLQLFAAAVVLVSPAGDLHGLRRRELQVLGLLVTGASNERIAGALGITTRTVELHVPHVRSKLAAPSRTAAAARALRLGLFVPFSLVTGA